MDHCTPNIFCFGGWIKDCGAMRKTQNNQYYSLLLQDSQLSCADTLLARGSLRANVMKSQS